MTDRTWYILLLCYYIKILTKLFYWFPRKQLNSTHMGLKAWSHECLRMTNECHFLASVDICRKCVSRSFDPLIGRSSLGNLRCLCVLLFFFVNVIRFSCVGLCGTRGTRPLHTRSERPWQRRKITRSNNAHRMNFPPGDKTDIKFQRISTDAKNGTYVHVHRLMRHSCDSAFSRGLTLFFILTKHVFITQVTKGVLMNVDLGKTKPGLPHRHFHAFESIINAFLSCLQNIWEDVKLHKRQDYLLEVMASDKHQL